MLEDDDEKRARAEMALFFRDLAAKLDAGPVEPEQITGALKLVSGSLKDYERGLERRKNRS